MNHVTLGMIGIWEILIILFLLVLLAGMAVGVVLLVVWLVRRQRSPTTDLHPPRPEDQCAAGKAERFSFAEGRAVGVRVRWGVYFLGLAAVVLGGSLLNGLLLAAGIWSGLDTVLFGLLVAVMVFHLFVIRDFHRAGRARPANSLPAGGIPPTNPAPPVSPPPAVCPRCGATMPPDSPQGLCPRCVLGVGLATQTEDTGEAGPHGTKIVPPPEAEVARRFPQLEIVGCLGHGGMGVVYKARQPKLNRLIALKILSPERGADPKFAERFLREAQALARLSHPNIVTVHDFGEADGMFFLLMEYVDGMTLRQLLREGRMKPEEALAIVPKICEALQFAHEQGVVHRDIKPENVLLDKQGRVKIADFGIAKLVGAERPPAALTEERSVIGTPHYMAPEQVEKPQLVDHRADIYSLGVVFYEMLTGELPLGKFQPPSKKVQVDVRLDEVVLHALEKEPERRYQHASQVKTDVETIATTPSAGSSGRESAPSEAARAPAVGDAKRNAKEATIVFAGTVFFLFMLAVVAELSLKAGPFRGFLVVICFVGLVICALSLAGIWPFPSSFFPEPNFSSRNLRRHKAAGPGTEQKPRFSPAAIAALIAAAIVLVLAVPVGSMLLAVFLPARLRQQQFNAEAVVRVEEKLRQEIEKRLGEAGWRLEGLSVNVAPNFKRAECRFGRIWKNGLTTEPPPPAAILFKPKGSNLWLVSGDGEFQWLRFSVDTSAEMAGELPVALHYSDAEESDSATSLALRSPRFGPVRELTLNHWVDDSPGGEALDLDRGELLDLPKEFERFPEPVQTQWLKDQGADLLLLFDRAQGRWGLITVAGNELKLASLPVEKWDTAKHADLSQASVAESVGLESRQRGEFRVYLFVANQHPPLTLAFHSAGGARGLLQITHFTEQRDSARLRYKLLQSSSGGVAAPTRKIVAPEFGPVRELTMKGRNETRTNCFIDLESGQVLDAPATLAMTNRAEVWEWAKAQGADAVAMTTQEIRGLLGYELIVVPLRDEDWEAVTSEDISKALTKAAFNAQRFPGQDPLAQFVMTVNTVSTSTNQPGTYAFRTREGSSGMLQFLSYTDAPGGSVTLRYKLVPSPSRPSAR